MFRVRHNIYIMQMACFLAIVPHIMKWTIHCRSHLASIDRL